MPTPHVICARKFCCCNLAFILFALELFEGNDQAMICYYHQFIIVCVQILDSTEEAIERSLASTGHATSRATEIYSKSSATSCLTWLLMFVMTCVFIMVVLLIRVT